MMDFYTEYERVVANWEQKLGVNNAAGAGGVCSLFNPWNRVWKSRLRGDMAAGRGRVVP